MKKLNIIIALIITVANIKKTAYKSYLFYFAMKKIDYFFYIIKIQKAMVITILPGSIYIFEKCCIIHIKKF